MIAVLKHLHVTMAGLSILGFVVRGWWAWANPLLLRRKPVRILPHVVDTLLLLSAIGMLVLYRWNPFEFAWLTAKIALLVVYIALGTIALKGRASGPVRVIAFVAAGLVFAWIVIIAQAHAFVPFS